MDATKHDYSPVASSDIEESRTSDEQLLAPHRRNGRSFYCHYTLYSLLLLSNIVLFGLWWRATLLSEVCVRPKLTYCTLLALEHGNPAQLYTNIAEPSHSPRKTCHILRKETSQTQYRR